MFPAGSARIRCGFLSGSLRESLPSRFAGRVIPNGSAEPFPERGCRAKVTSPGVGGFDFGTMTLIAVVGMTGPTDVHFPGLRIPVVIGG